LGAGFRDTFERAAIGDDYRTVSSAWRIIDGELCAEQAHNQGVWLRRRLPASARIEVDARSASRAGDIKMELWGDGKRGASKATYDDASGYVLIFGGWHNRRHVLARRDEHGKDRLAIEVGGADPRGRPVKPNTVYHFRIDRLASYKLRVWINDEQMFEFSDPEPLVGVGHDHFGFNDWKTPVCFDNLEVTPLEDAR